MMNIHLVIYCVFFTALRHEKGRMYIEFVAPRTEKSKYCPLRNGFLFGQDSNFNAAHRCGYMRGKKTPKTY